MKKLLLLPIFLGVVSIAQAQDFHLSLYDASPLTLNPSLTGQFAGKHRIHGHFRTQWSAVATRPFTTGIVSFDTKLPKRFAVGGYVANLNAGAGIYNNAALMVSGSYWIPMDQAKHHRLSVGVAAGFFQKSINPDKLYFDAQYLPYNGGSWDPSADNQEVLSNNNIFNHDVSVGLTYFWAKPGNRVNPYGGMTVYHYTMPKESFYADGNRLPVRWVANAGARVGINDKISLHGKVFYMHQRKANEVTFSLVGQYYVSDWDMFFMFGPTYRNKDAAILEFGVKWGQLTGRFAYDINTSSLSNSTNGRGGSEFGITYIFEEAVSEPKPNCNRL